MEYLVVALDDAAKKARLSLAQAEILKSLARDEALWKEGSCTYSHNKEQWVDPVRNLTAVSDDSQRG